MNTTKMLLFELKIPLRFFFEFHSMLCRMKKECYQADKILYTDRFCHVIAMPFHCKKLQLNHIKFSLLCHEMKAE